MKHERDFNKQQPHTHEDAGVGEAESEANVHEFFKNVTAEETAVLAEVVEQIKQGEPIETKGVIGKLAERAKLIAVGFSLISALSVAAGKQHEAHAQDRSTQDTRVDDVYDKYKGTMDRMQEKFEQGNDQTKGIYERFQSEVQRIDEENRRVQEHIEKGDFGDNKSMQEKYYNFDRYSQAFNEFKESFAKEGITDDFAARFVLVLKEFPEFESPEQLQRMQMDVKNFRRLVTEYAKMRYGKEKITPALLEQAVQELWATYQFVGADTNDDGKVSDGEKREFHSRTNEVMGWSLLREFADPKIINNQHFKK